MISLKKYQDWKKVKKEAELLQMRNCKRVAEINNSCRREKINLTNEKDVV